jgi:hypothetical protein
MKKIIFFILLLAGSISRAQMIVPEKYQNIYHDYYTGLEKFNSFLDENKSDNAKPIIFGAELLAANSNRGQNLLNSITIPAVEATLKAFKEMGIKAVTMGIGFPVFTDDIHQAKEYIDFYKKTAKLVRDQNMKLCVKLHVLHSGIINLNSGVDLSKMTIDKLKEAKKLMAQKVINDLKPDYLSLCGEPDFEAKLLGLEALADPKEYTALVKYIIKDLKRGKTLVGAGQGAWGTADYAKELAKLNLDFINIHVYPFGTKVFDVMNQICLAAKQNKKKIIIDEFWLYKLSKGEDTSVNNRDNIYKKDHYSFWQPVDKLFIEAMVRYASLNEIEFISPFWSNNFFAYLDYLPEYDRLSYFQENIKFNQTAADNMQTGKLSETGKFYSELIKKYK